MPDNQTADMLRERARANRMLGDEYQERAKLLYQESKACDARARELEARAERITSE